MPNLTHSTCRSDADCNGEGKCIQADDDGTFYCDCTIGYIEPHCRNRDPCLLEGNLACQNGSTCKRKSNFEYECKCRVPYDGEFCETYDLCDVDVDECIGDLNRDDLMDPICNPCATGATCIQISKRHYICSCVEGYNHSACYAVSDDSDNIRMSFISDKGDQKNTWNPIIPTIALTSCCLYFLLLLILLILLRKRKKNQPKLIVCCDIREFDNLSYYLISVETGSQWNAGTNSNVYCFLCGEKGQAGPYPLCDRNLSEVHVLQRCQENNYLISHSKDLGLVYKIVLWYDDKPTKSSWFCDKITIRNIKTDQNWFFYASTWFDSNNTKHKKRRHEFPVATIEYVRQQSSIGVSISCQHYSYQMERYHTYISPFIYPTPDRITLLFTEWMSYMLILISLYGFLMIADEDISYPGEYVKRAIVLENGSLAAFACFWIGLTCSLLLMLFLRVKRIPTLIIWHNKPGMPNYGSRKSQQPPKRPSVSPAPKSKDESTDTLFDWNSTTGGDGGLDQTDSGVLFRIPSTDVVKTEKWVDKSVDHTNDSNELIDEALVHAYNPSNPQNIPDAVLDYGLIGGLTDGRQQEPNRFVYATNSHESNIVCAEIEKDIHDIYGGFQMEISSKQSKKPLDSQAASNGLFENMKAPPTPKIFIEEMQLGDKDSKETQTSIMGAGDFLRDEEMSKKQKVYCELCEMDVAHFWNTLARTFMIIGWVLCIALIVAATVICCIYGGRYGYERTYDWIISLIFCWLENFLVYQFLKILFLVLIVSLLVKRKKIPSLEAAKLSERFQLYYVNGLTVFPDKHALRFVQYLPKNWIPLPHVQLESSNVNSDTSITKEPDKNV